MSKQCWGASAHSGLLVCRTLVAVPLAFGWLQRVNAHAWVVEPFDGAVIAVARNHLSKRHALAIAVYRLLAVTLASLQDPQGSNPSQTCKCTGIVEQ
jgi:hypothetical protein